MSRPIKEIEKNIGYRFSNHRLLDQAMAHSSCQNIKDNTFDRLEYLGDAVLELIISEFLFRTCPHYTEGELTKVRTGVVSENSLFMAAKRIGIHENILLGKGEENSAGREKPSILSDALEALIGALYLDSDLKTVTSVVLKLLKSNIENAIDIGGTQDYKTKLQEELQSRSSDSIHYDTTQMPDEKSLFHAIVYHGVRMLGKGSGRRKKLAEQAAAQDALKKLR
ncbi:MAG: ribonuclease III [Christensenellales bacterium]|jgi:ribonuclease-3